jgi:hypothetical protein
MEEVKQKSIPDIIRETAVNQTEFLTRLAIHIDALEKEVMNLSQRVVELETNAVENHAK